MPFVLALDQGTTSSRALVFDGGGAVTGMAQQELKQIYPQPGWVEHDPTDIWATQSGAMHEALAVAGITGRDVAAGDARHRQRLVHGARLCRPDIRRIVLDPAGLGIDLLELLLGHAGHGAAAVEDERARAGRTLVEGEDARHGRDGSCRTAAGEPRTPLRYHRPPWSPARKISSKASTPNRPPPCRTARGHSSSSRARVRGRRAS